MKPRLLASAFEALVGALYLDAEFSFVKNYLLKEFNLDIEKIKPDLEYEKDYKTRLQELSQKMKLGMPSYEVLSTSGPSHKPEFQVSVSIKDLEIQQAIGHSKKIAEQSAAKIALQILNQKIEKTKNKGQKNANTKK